MDLDVINLDYDSGLNLSDLKNLNNGKNYCFVTTQKLIHDLKSCRLPLSNSELATLNILTFLTHIDDLYKFSNKTLLPIHSSEWAKYFSFKKYLEYQRTLSDLDVITVVPYIDKTWYKKNELTKQYQLHNSYINDEQLCLVLIQTRYFKRSFECSVQGLDERYKHTIETVNPDYYNAVRAEIDYMIKNERSISNLRLRLSRLLDITNHRFIKQGDKSNRIYHSFSNISKVSRQHLSRRFYYIDVKNCQPTLLVTHLKINKMNYDKNYQTDVEKGTFYEIFINKTNTREQVKDELFSSIFFDFKTYYKMNEDFKMYYPETWKSLKEIHSDESKTLASQLQLLESDLFNNLIPEKSKYFFTLFDSIYFDAYDDYPMLDSKIKKYFNDLGVKVETKK